MITLKSSVYLKETKKLRKKKEKRNPPKEHAFVYLSTLIIHLRVSFTETELQFTCCLICFLLSTDTMDIF